MRLLLPVPSLDRRGADTQLTTDELAQLYRPREPAAGAPVSLRANVVATLDGAGYGPDRRSGSINDPDDRRLFAVLRATSDVVLVGAGTTRTERYGPARTPPDLQAVRAAAHDDPAPPIAVVSRSLDVGEPLLEDPRTIVVTTGSAPADRLRRLADRVDVAVCGDDDLDLSRVVDELAARGHRHVLCEGGPTLLGALAAERLVDDLCVTTAAWTLGGDAPRFAIGLQLDPMTRWTPVSVAIDDEGYLFTRWHRA